MAITKTLAQMYAIYLIQSFNLATS